MRAIRRHNRGAYRQPRWHLFDDSDSSVEPATLCGTDVSQVKGDRRGAYGPGIIEEADIEDIGGIQSYSICAKCRKKADPKPSAPKLSNLEMAALYDKADAAGREAATATTPPTMLVGTPKNMVASLMGEDDGGLDPEKPIYVEPDGPCGFGWIIVRPGTSRFARWLKETGRGRADSYAGGVSIWIGAYQQSMYRKEAHAEAMAKVLREAGIKATAHSRMD